MKSPRSTLPASCSRASASSGEPTRRRSTSLVVLALSRRSSSTRPPLSIAALPSTRMTRASKRSNTSSCRLRASSTPDFEESRSRCPRAALKPAGVAYVRGFIHRARWSVLMRWPARSADHPARERLTDCRREEFRRDVICRRVGECSRRRSDRHGADPCSVALGHVRIVQHDTFRNSKSALAPLCRQSQVRPRRQYIGELVQHQRSLVREHACPIGPKPKGDQVLLLTGREILEPVHTPPDAGELAAGEVLHQKLRRVSGVERLLGREVALLRQGSLVEAVPVRRRLSTPSPA